MVSGETERRRGFIPFLPRLPLPNPLSWVPKLRIPGRRRSDVESNAGKGGIKIGRRSSLAPASTSISTGDAGLSSAALATATSTVATGSRVPLKPMSDVFCGALARAASQSTIHPLDTLKVRLQTKGALAQASSAVPGLSKIGQLVPPLPSNLVPPTASSIDIKAIGQTVSSLYRGVVGAASGAGIAIGAYFAFYGVACNIISRNTDLPAGGVAFAAGGVAALGSSFVKVPLAVCIRSVQAGVYPNFFAAARSIMDKAGPRGLFTGYLPTVLEDVPDMAIKFAAYESMRQLHAKAFEGRSPSFQEDFAMGATSGALAAAATTPLDVIKTNMMCTAAQRPSMLGAASLVYAQGGPAAFFRGVGARAASNGINSAVFFVFFEALKVEVARRKAASEAAHVD